MLVLKEKASVQEKVAGIFSSQPLAQSGESGTATGKYPRHLLEARVKGRRSDAGLRTVAHAVQAGAASHDFNATGTLPRHQRDQRPPHTIATAAHPRLTPSLPTPQSTWPT